MKGDKDYTSHAYKLYWVNGEPISSQAYHFKCEDCNERALVIQKGKYICAKCYIKENFPDDMAES